MLHTLLKEKLGFNQFRPGQKEVIEDVQSGSNVFAMLPTGTGKTLCYLLSGWLLGGLTLIVSPLLSLMEDQVRQIKLMGEKRVAALNSFLSPEERKLLFAELESLRFLFISPEMLQVPAIQRKLMNNGVRLFVVDEAHCISQWGHDFRPDYLKLAEMRKQLGRPQCLALTATADQRVQQDIMDHLEMKPCKTHLYSIDRANIALKVEQVTTPFEKQARLVEWVKTLQGPGLIYFSSREGAELAANLIQKQTSGNLRVAFYHAGMTGEDRLFIQHQFLNNQLDVVCSTNAFGMGLNKSNIRYVIHFHYPSSLNAYVQEIGRAGRDGQPAIAMTLVSPEDHVLPEAMIERDFPKQNTFAWIYQKAKQTEWTAHSFYKIALEVGESETAARFLSEQVGGILADSLEKSWYSLKLLIDQRKSIKLEDLRKMREWLYTKACRRAALLKAYDEKETAFVEPCCDYCGLDLDRYASYHEGDSQPNHSALIEDWEGRLRGLLGINT